MKHALSITAASIACLIVMLASATESAKQAFPAAVDWIKRSHHVGCTDPTEPFQCPGSNICISLQFLCDGHPGDCPDNYDENKGLCIAGT
jgi:hypothetical protein